MPHAVYRVTNLDSTLLLIKFGNLAVKQENNIQEPGQTDRQRHRGQAEREKKTYIWIDG